MRKINQVRIGYSLHFEELQQLPEYLIELIHSTKLGDPNYTDNVVWMPSTTGLFTTSSAWQAIRQSRGITPILKGVWHKYLPYKMSFLM